MKKALGLLVATAWLAATAGVEVALNYL
jgi:hypothetical protein